MNTIALRKHQKFLSNGSYYQVTCIFKRLLGVRWGVVQRNTNEWLVRAWETGEEVAEGGRYDADGTGNSNSYRLT